MTNDLAVSRYHEAMKTKKFLPFQEELTEEIKVKAEEELGETEETQARAIAELRSLIKKDTKLVCSTDDEYLIGYLRPRKYNVKKAFHLFQNYYHTKKAFSDIYDRYDLDLMKRIYAFKAVLVLPYRDSDGCAIYIIKIANWDPDTLNMDGVVVALTSALLRCIETPISGVCGIRVIVDCKNITLKQVRCVTPRYLSLMARALRNCFPCRFKGIHIYNESIIFQYLWSILKLFLSEKIKKRVHFHGDNQKSLHKVIPKAILPVEYGGDNPEDVGDWFYTEMEKYFERYHELTTYGYKS